MDMPLPPLPKSKPKPIGALTDDESTHILDTCLLPKNRDDLKVLAFIDSYLRCRNASQAAREAGMMPQRGIYLRNRPDIHLAITKLTEKSVMKHGFDASEVVERVKEISEVDPIVFERPDGTYITSLSEIPPESRRAIKKFKVKNLWGERVDPNGIKEKIIVGQLVEVELYDKMKAHEMLGREKDLFKQTTKVEHDVTKNMADVLLESGRRAAERKALMSGEGEVIDVTPTDSTSEES